MMEIIIWIVKKSVKLTAWRCAESESVWHVAPSIAISITRERNRTKKGLKFLSTSCAQHRNESKNLHQDDKISASLLNWKLNWNGNSLRLNLCLVLLIGVESSDHVAHAVGERERERDSGKVRKLFGYTLGASLPLCV